MPQLGPLLALPSGDLWTLSDAALFEFLFGQLRLKDLFGAEFDNPQANMQDGGDGEKDDKWFVLNAGAATVIDIDTTVPGALYVRHNGTSTNWRNEDFTAPFIYREIIETRDLDINIPAD